MLDVMVLGNCPLGARQAALKARMGKTILSLVGLARFTAPFANYSAVRAKDRKSIAMAVVLEFLHV